MWKMAINFGDSAHGCCLPFISDLVERLEIISIFNLTPSVFTEICEITFKDGIFIDDWVRKNNIVELNVIRHSGQKYTCFIKGKIIVDKISDFIGNFELKLEFPIIVDRYNCRFSLVGRRDELYNIIRKAKEGWKIEVLSFEKYDPANKNMLDSLTAMQKEVLKQAYLNGYFSYPRKITPQKLADQLGIKKATLLEHLRKAENKILHRIIK